MNIKRIGLILLTLVWLGSNTQTMANPQGGDVAAGNASIQNNGSTTTITQTSDKAIINWQTFNINQGETTQFVQPSAAAIALNRVNASYGASKIMGNLFANGNVWIINPAGIMFGSTAQVNVAGLLATTANISDQDFMNGNYKFTQDPNYPNSAVVNQGTIKIADGGMAALVAPGVENSGVIQANMGRVTLAAGTNYTVDLYGDKLINFGINSEVTQKAVDANGRILNDAVTNSGTIIADGGRVMMTATAAKNVVDNVINMSGYIQANTVSQRGGEIVLSGGTNGTVRVTGKLVAAGKTIGKGGSIKVLGENIRLMNAMIDASGLTGGGEILIGGNYQGKGPEQNAKTTYVDANSSLNASAINEGDGGTIVVWSDDITGVAGQLYARGGDISGNGGLIETSGHNLLGIAGSYVDLRAPNGTTGTWLLDPTDLTISNAATTNVTFASDTYTGDQNFTNSNINVDELILALNSASITVQTTTTSTGSGSGTGLITVVNDLVYNSANTLFINAANNLVVNSGVTLQNSGSGGITLISNNNQVIINSGALIATAGGTLVVQANDVTLNGNLSNPTGTVQLVSTGANMGIGTASGNMSVSNSELQKIAAATLTFSSSGNTTVAGVNSSDLSNITSQINIFASNLASSNVTFNGAATSLPTALSLIASEGVTINANLTTNGITQFNVDSDSTNTGIFSIANGVTLSSNNHALSIRAADYNANVVGSTSGALNAGTGTLVLTAVGSYGLGGGSGNFVVNNTELSHMTANNFVISAGNSSNADIQSIQASDIANITGNITLNAVGTTSIGGTVSFTGNSVFNTLNVNADTGITINNNLTTSGATSLNADVDADGTGSFTSAAATAISTGGNTLNISGNDFILGGTLSSGAAQTTITGTGAVGVGAAAATMAISKAELQNMTAGNFVVNAGNGNLSINNVVNSDITNITGSFTFNGIISASSTVVFTGTASTISRVVNANATNGVNFNVGLTTNNVTTLNANYDGDTTGTLFINNGTTLNTTNRTLNITAYDFNSSTTGNITSGSGSTTINGTSNVGLNVAVTGMNISGDELQRILSGSFNLNTGGSGNMTVSGISSTQSANVNSVRLNALSSATSSITVSGASSFESVNLSANNGITISAPLTTTIANTSTNLIADNDGNGTGALNISANISTPNAINFSGAGINFTGSPIINPTAGALSFNAGGGAINFATSTLTTTNATASAIAINNASTVALGNITATSGTLGLGTSQNITGAVTQNASTAVNVATLTASTANSLNLSNTTNQITTLSDVTRGGSFTLYDSTGGLNITGNLNTGTTTNDINLTTAGGALNASGILVGNTLTAKTLNNTGSDITFSNSANDFTTVNLASRNAADNANAAGAISFQDVNGFDITNLQTTSSANLTGRGNITGTGSLVGDTLIVTTLNDSGASINLNNAGNHFSTISLSTRNAANTSNTAGDITYQDSGTVNISSINTTANVNLSADQITDNGSILANTLTVTADNGIVLDAGHQVNTFNASNTTSGNIEFANTASTLNISGISLDSSGNIIVNNTGAVSITGAVSNTGGGDINLTSSAAFTVDAAITASNTGGISLTANGGSSNLTLNSSLTTDSGAIGLTAGNSILIGNGNLDTTGTVAMNANTISTTGSGIISANRLQLDSINGALLTNNNLVAELDAQNNSSGNIEFNNTTSSLRLIEVQQANNGDIIINNNGDVLNDGLISITGSTGNISITATNGSYTQNPGFIMLIAGTGDINITATGTGNDITFDSSASTGTGNINFNAASDVIMKNLITTNGNINITAGDTITSNTGQLSTPGSINVTSNGNMTFNGNIEDASALTLNAGSSGDIIFNADVGDLGAIGSFTVANANNVTVNSEIFTNTFSQLAGSGVTDFGTTLNASSNVVINTVNTIGSVVTSGSLSLNTSLANLVSTTVLSDTGEQAARNTTVLNTIGPGTHFVNGFDLYQFIPQPGGGGTGTGSTGKGGTTIFVDPNNILAPITYDGVSFIAMETNPYTSYLNMIEKEICAQKEEKGGVCHPTEIDHLVSKLTYF